jgi:ABC-type Fe3+-hydroxamate transport system substrate-binding protein
MKKFLGVAVALAALAGLSACSSDADVASKNISTAADNFQVPRRVVLYNGITNEYIQVVEGLCSLGNNDGPGEVSVTCKTDKGFIKHIWKLGDNVTVFAEQLTDVQVSTSFYKVIFKPSSILPDIDIR